MDNNEELIRLVDRAKNGDQEAFTDLYNSAYKMVYLTCMSHLKNNEDAEDAAQEVFINVYNKLNMLTDNRTFYGWVKTIAVHTSLNKIAARKGNISYDDAIESGENLDGSDDLEMLPDSVIFEEEKRKIMMNIISASLSEVQYQTVVMYYYDELPIGQISQILNCPVPTIKKRLKVARIKIREGIEDYEHKTGDKLCAAAAIPSLGMLFKSTFGVPSVGLVGSAVPAGIAASAQQPQTRAPHDTSDNQPVKGNGSEVQPQPTKAGASQASTASKAGKAVASTAKKGLGIKIAATAAAVAVVGTGTVVAVNLLSDSVKPFDPDKTYVVGDSFTMGNFDGEDLTWKVIDEKNDKYFVVLDSDLGTRAFDEDSASWKDSDLRTWLNEELIYDAFDKDEYKYIRGSYDTELRASNKIFELSADEVENLLDDDTIAIGSEYWLRTPSEDGTQVAAVDENGEIIYVDFDEELAVRPAMWVGVETEEPVVETTAPVMETEPVIEDRYYNVGDDVDFGTYNGAVLNWRILDNQDGNCLLILNDFIGIEDYWNVNQYDTPNGAGETLYRDSNVRSLLVGSFYENAFTDAQKERIVLTEIASDYYEDIEPGPDSSYTDEPLYDPVFLLSTDEAQRYYERSVDRVIRWDSYGAWWLRTPGVNECGMCLQYCVNTDGSISSGGYIRIAPEESLKVGIRPAMWVNLGPAAPFVMAEPLDQMNYEAFINGEARVDASALSIYNFPTNPEGYTISELGAYLESRNWADIPTEGTHAEYTYIDCGSDGYPELLVRYNGLQTDWDGNSDSIVMVISGYDGQLKITYFNYQDHYSYVSISSNGVVESGRGGGAGSDQVYDEGYLDNYGNYHRYFYELYSESDMALDGVPGYESFASCINDVRGNEYFQVRYAQLITDDSEGEVYIYSYDDHDSYSSVSFNDACANAGFRLYSSGEIDQIRADHAAAVGAPVSSGSEYEWTQVY